ncbi:MAG: hypothetical protein M5R36_18265 [Deltaproteobacteria bacterium]|nr:hypothetical protein [Deltaproteobacteria bacterium]
MDDRERRNLVMTKDASAPSVESFFFKTADPSGATSIWVKFTLLTPAGGRPATAGVWATRVVPNRPERCVAARIIVPRSEVRFENGRAGFAIGDSAFGAGWTRGQLTDLFGRTLAWDLKLDDADPLFLFSKAWMYDAKIPRFKTATPYADTRAHGTIAVDGTEIKVNGARAMQGHNWGAEHSEEYAWAHCNRFDDHPNTVFEGFSARVPAGPFGKPMISTAVLRHEDRTYRFDGWKSLRTRDIAINRHSWSFTFRQGPYALSGMVIAHRHDFAGLFYTNPDGAERLCVNSNLANINMELLDAATGDRIIKLTTNRGAMLELISPENWHDVCVYVPAEARDSSS